MGLSVERKIEVYIGRGWCPVPWRHHPQEIRDEIRRLGFRPQLKQCFRNSQIFLVGSTLEGLEYMEGWSRSPSGIPVVHAWLLYDGKPLDLTSETLVPICGTKYKRDDVGASARATEMWQAINESEIYSQFGEW